MTPDRSSKAADALAQAGCLIKPNRGERRRAEHIGDRTLRAHRVRAAILSILDATPTDALREAS